MQWLESLDSAGPRTFECQRYPSRFHVRQTIRDPRLYAKAQLSRIKLAPIPALSPLREHPTRSLRRPGILPPGLPEKGPFTGGRFWPIN
jgi:hypothetical protein